MSELKVGIPMPYIEDECPMCCNKKQFGKFVCKNCADSMYGAGAELTDLKRRLREAVDEIDEEMLKMFNKVDQWGTMTGMVYANILRKHLHIELEMVSDTNQQEE